MLFIARYYQNSYDQYVNIAHSKICKLIEQHFGGGAQPSSTCQIKYRQPTTTLSATKLTFIACAVYILFNRHILFVAVIKCLWSFMLESAELQKKWNTVRRKVRISTTICIYRISSVHLNTKKMFSLNSCWGFFFSNALNENTVSEQKQISLECWTFLLISHSRCSIVGIACAFMVDSECY